MEHDIINDMAVCIVAAWILAVCAQLTRQPLILAYLIAGFVAGPLGIGLVKDRGSIESISGLGLILLLFMIGLEIDLKKILSAGRIITITAATQILGGCLLGVLYFWSQGFQLANGQLDALYLAVAAALSSTVISVKILYDKRELDTLVGRITLGVLVLQDLFAVLFLSLQSNLKEPAVGLLFQSLFRAVLLVAAGIYREQIRVAGRLQSGGQAARTGAGWRAGLVFYGGVAGQYAGPVAGDGCVDRRGRHFHLPLHPGCHGQGDQSA